MGVNDNLNLIKNSVKPYFAVTEACDNLIKEIPL
jgi:hypothetical protein